MTTKYGIGDIVQIGEATNVILIEDIVEESNSRYIYKCRWLQLNETDEQPASVIDSLKFAVKVA